jgi:hypothetical protein
MHHRYGRHGARAWLRQHMHRYTRASSLLVPVNTAPVTSLPVVSPSLFCVFVPSSTERIIFIIMPNAEHYEDGNERIPVMPFPDSRLIGPSEDERAESYTKIRGWATFEASTYYDSISQSVHDRGAEWSTVEAIKREAAVKADVALRPFVNTTLDIEAAKRFYIEVYLQTYQARYEADTGDGTLPTQETKRVKELAQRDARKDKQDGIELEEPELTYHAVIAIEYAFGYQARSSNGYLTHISRHMPHYKRAYREEIDRPQRSSPFPSEWQASRSS